jgi:hypothetical protein
LRFRTAEIRSLIPYNLDFFHFTWLSDCPPPTFFLGEPDVGARYIIMTV